MTPTQPQFSFPSEPFALMTQSTLDGDNLARLAEQRRQDRTEAEKMQTEIKAKYPSRAAHQQAVYNELMAAGKTPVRAEYDDAGNCKTCDECGRCPGWH